MGNWELRTIDVIIFNGTEEGLDPWNLTYL